MGPEVEVGPLSGRDNIVNTESGTGPGQGFINRRTLKLKLRGFFGKSMSTCVFGAKSHDPQCFMYTVGMMTSS